MTSLQGAKEFEAALRAWQVRQLAAAEVATRMAAELVQTEIKMKLTQQAHAKGTKTPSAPGQPPAYIGGHLVQGVVILGPESVGSGFMARIGPTAAYGRIQELGGIAGHGSKLPARPYVRPSLLSKMDEIGIIFYSAWSGA